MRGVGCLDVTEEQAPGVGGGDLPPGPTAAGRAEHRTVFPAHPLATWALTASRPRSCWSDPVGTRRQSGLRSARCPPRPAPARAPPARPRPGRRRDLLPPPSGRGLAAGETAAPAVRNRKCRRVAVARLIRLPPPRSRPARTVPRCSRPARTVPRCLSPCEDIAFLSSPCEDSVGAELEVRTGRSRPG